MNPGQVLPRHFARRQVLDILRDEASSLLKFVKSLVEILRFFEFKTRARKPDERPSNPATGAWQRGRAAGVGAERWSCSRMAASAARQTPASN